MKLLKYIILANFILLSNLLSAEISPYELFQGESSTAKTEGGLSTIPSQKFRYDGLSEVQSDGYDYTDEFGMVHLDGILYAPPSGGDGGWVKMPVGDSIWLFFLFAAVYYLFIILKKRKKPNDLHLG